MPKTASFAVRTRPLQASVAPMHAPKPATLLPDLPTLKLMSAADY